VPRDRVLIIDEDLSPRLARYLRERGRHARSVADLGLRNSKDPELLRELANRRTLGEWVLVTGNDAMPAEHAALSATCDRRWRPLTLADPSR
jgi:predicted nuclease of predicted toxin-antitoxin system